MSDPSLVNQSEIEQSPPLFPLRPTASNGSKAIPTLVFADEDDNPKSFPILNEVVRIGSSVENDLILAGIEASHAVLEVDHATVTIRKLGLGAITVNNFPVEVAELQPGDVIRLDSAIVVVSVDLLDDESRDPPWTLIPDDLFQVQENTPGLGTKPLDALTAGSLQWLNLTQRLNALSKKIDDIDQEDLMLKHVAHEILEIFSATYSFVVILEEDGRNPAMVEKAFRMGHGPSSISGEIHQDTKAKVDEAASLEIDETVLAQALENRQLCDFHFEADDKNPERFGLAAQIVHRRKCIGLVYFERPAGEGEVSTLDSEMFEVLARILALPISHL